MCLLTLHNGKSKLTDKAFKKAFASNGDGVGMSWRKDGVIYSFKTLALDEALAKYKSLIDYQELVLHFRFGTSGLNDINLVHGFKLNNETSLLFHNGVLSSVPIIEGQSDTSTLALYIKNIKLTDEQIFSNGMSLLLFNYISVSNKFVILNKLGYKIYGEKHGERNGNNDIWYSNKYWSYGITKTDYLDSDLIINNWRNGIQRTDGGAENSETTNT